jgi:hypothetical protein
MTNRDIKQTLIELHRELETTEEVDEDLRALLREVDDDIHELLAGAQHSPGVIDGLRGRLEALAADFAGQHPNTERFFREVIHALGRMGI